LEELNENSSIQVTNNLGIISKIFTAKSSGEYMIKATYT
jgi:hypothetical protein